MFGKSDNAVVNVLNLDGAGFRIDGEKAGDLSGRSVSGAGDVNGDGLADLIIGAPGGATFSEGRTYILLSGPNGFLPSDLTHTGTAGNDTLTGTIGNDRMAAGTGNDVLIGNGGVDVMYGGAGRDVFVMNASNLAPANLTKSRIDGGTGLDTLRFADDTNGVALDLTTLSDLVLKGIEKIQFSTATGVSNTLKLGVRDMLAIHDEGGIAAGSATLINRLIVAGDANDVVQLSTNGGTWVKDAATQVIDNVTYDIYKASLVGVVDRLLVQQGALVEMNVL